MNKRLNSYSESLVLSLCKEIEYIKNRSKNINFSLKYCQNKLLTERLRYELSLLNKNRSRIHNISKRLFNRNSSDLSLKFLIELTKRYTTYQQI